MKIGGACATPPFPTNGLIMKIKLAATCFVIGGLLIPALTHAADSDADRTDHSDRQDDKSEKRSDDRIGAVPAEDFDNGNDHRRYSLISPGRSCPAPRD
jgi:hypothetical protein